MSMATESQLNPRRRIVSEADISKSSDYSY